MRKIDAHILADEAHDLSFGPSRYHDHIKILFGLVAFTSQAVAWASLDVDDTEKRCADSQRISECCHLLALPLEDNKCRFKTAN